MRNLCSALGAACLILSLSGVARADEAADRAAARDHFQKGTKFFDLGHFDEAIKEYEAAYELRDEPVLLYNIAQAHRLAGHASQASHFYKAYLRRSPKAPNREEVENKIAELDKLVQQQQRAQTLPPDQPIVPGEKTAKPDKPKPTPPTPPTEVATSKPPPSAPPPSQPPPSPPPPRETQPQPSSPQETQPQPSEPPPSEQPPPETAQKPPEEQKPAGPGFFGGPGKTKKIVGIALLGVGVVGIAVGGAMSAMAVGAGNDVVAEANAGQQFNPSKESTGKTDQIVAGVMYGIGGAAVAAGAVMLYLGVRDDKNAAATHAMVVPLVSPTTAGAALHVRF